MNLELAVCWCVCRRCLRSLFKQSSLASCVLAASCSASMTSWLLQPCKQPTVRPSRRRVSPQTTKMGSCTCVDNCVLRACCIVFATCRLRLSGLPESSKLTLQCAGVCAPCLCCDSHVETQPCALSRNSVLLCSYKHQSCTSLFLVGTKT